MRDEWVIVIDFLSRGRVGMQRSEPVAQTIGEKYFSLLEIMPREGSEFTVGERVYIGEGKRDKVRYIRGRIRYSDLTVASKEELCVVVEKLVDADQQRFVDFFSKAGPVTNRLHHLELIPGIGKKHLWDIIEARKEKPFSSFEDLSNRVKLLPDPRKMIIRRILDELEDKDKYKLFVSGAVQRPQQ